MVNKLVQLLKAFGFSLSTSKKQKVYENLPNNSLCNLRNIFHSDNIGFILSEITFPLSFKLFYDSFGVTNVKYNPVLCV